MLFVGSDHAGFDLKSKILDDLKARKIDAEDCGTFSSESCDYPTFAEEVCLNVSKNPGDLGLLICGTGVGMSIAANKMTGIRAACVSEEKSAATAREHNNAQVLCLGARIIAFDKAKLCVNAFLNARFDTENPRHQRRIELISELEGK